MPNLNWVPVLTVLSLSTVPAHALQAEDVADIWNKTKIVTAYTLDTEINPFDLEVEVRDGTAYLAGTVRTEEEKQRAESLALAVDGVKAVENMIILDENIPHNQAKFEAVADAVSDANITAMVKAQLLWNDLTHALKISVSTRDRVVTLSGPVTSEKEAREAVRIAGSTRMVSRVNNALVVVPNPGSGDRGS